MSGPSGGKHGKSAPIAAEIFLKTLSEHGVDYFFCNPGTDFPPIVEAFTRAQGSNAKLPQPVLVPHENLAVAMAHGVYLDDRAAAGRDGSRQCRHRQHHQQHHQCLARPRTADPRRRPHALHREGQLRLAQPLDPLGAGNVRPGRHAARTGQMGL